MQKHIWKSQVATQYTLDWEVADSNGLQWSEQSSSRWHLWIPDLTGTFSCNRGTHSSASRRHNRAKAPNEIFINIGIVSKFGWCGQQIKTWDVSKPEKFQAQLPSLCSLNIAVKLSMECLIWNLSRKESPKDIHNITTKKQIYFNFSEIYNLQKRREKKWFRRDTRYRPAMQDKENMNYTKWQELRFRLIYSKSAVLLRKVPSLGIRRLHKWRTWRAPSWTFRDCPHS